jgi:hypothetical protein
MAAPRQTDLHPRKFKELVLYASEKAADHPRFGVTKLNKILFFSDMEAYARLGQSITGDEYQRLEKGPAARKFTPLIKEMLKDHEIKFVKRRVYDYDEDVPVLWESRPKPNAFTPEEREIIDGVIEDLRRLDATESSDLSHLRSAGWRVLRNGETIPYEAWLIDPEPADDEAVAFLRRAEGLPT